MPMFSTPAPSTTVPQVPMRLGLLPNPADPRTMPVAAALRPFGLGRGGREESRSSAPAYSPKDLIEAQQRMGDQFSSRPPAAYNWPGYIGTAGNAFMGTYLPARAEARMQENERISADAARRAAGATSLEDAIAALSGGDPSQRNAAMSARLEALDPMRRAQIALAETQARAAQREIDFEDQIMGGGAQRPPQAPAAPPAQAPAPPSQQQPPTATPVQAPPAPPQQDAAPLPPALQGIWNANPLPEPADEPSVPSGPAAPAAPPPAATASLTPVQTAADVNRDHLAVLATRPVLERRAWAKLLKKDPAKAMTQLEEWADPQAGQRRVIAREAAETEGKLTGTARSNMPLALQAANSMIRNIDAVITDPNRTRVTGWQAADWYANPTAPGQPHLFGIPLNPLAYTPTDSATETSRERIRQVQGQAFMQAYQAIRGAGAISDQEGARAAAAITRLDNLKQGDEDYTTALHDARREIWELYNVARAKAGQPPLPYTPHASAPTNPQGGNVPDADGWITMPGNVRIRRLP